MDLREVGWGHGQDESGPRIETGGGLL
jgi:hypothetical protein